MMIQNAIVLLGEKDTERNAKAAPLLAEAVERYGAGINALEKALKVIK